MSRTAQPEQLRLDAELRARIAEHLERVNRRLAENRTGVRRLSRAEVLRALLRAGLDASETT